MSSVFIAQADGSWSPSRLRAPAYLLPADPPQPVDPQEIQEANSAVLVRDPEPGPDADRWSLLAPLSLCPWVNEVPLHGGLRRLRHRDAIRLGARTPLYFSIESPAEIETYAGTGASVYCPRCTAAVEPGQPVVRCPGCGLFHHQLEARPCWLYAPHCGGCDYPTVLDGGYRWTPEEIWS